MSKAQTTYPIPLFDLRLDDAQIIEVEEVLRSGWLSMGPKVEAFEAEFAEHLGVAHTVAVNSGTAALHLAYLAAGIGPGDEAIVPGITFVASAAAVRYCGGTPVLADIVGDGDLSLDPDDVAARITPRTKAVCVVHYGGYAGPIDPLLDLCESHGLTLIEDAAHSPSATLPGSDRKLGTFGLAATFSFFSNKVLSCGEGGLLATNDDQVADLARTLRSHGMTSTTWDRHRGGSASYDVTDLGFNYRLDEPRAALLSARLPGLAADIAERRRLTLLYRSLLGDHEGIALPYTDEQVGASSCYTMPVVLADGALRDPVQERLRDHHQIQTSVLYPSVDGFTAYRKGQTRLPRCERLARSQLSLPLYPHLGDDGVKRVVDALGESLAAVTAPAGAPADDGA
jgi:dTDP-4-amino-4,6-dideoxygalactose transaminase